MPRHVQLPLGLLPCSCSLQLSLASSPLLSHSIRLATALFCAASLASCDAIGEPGRFYNDDVRPPTVSVLDAADLTPGQSIAGTVRLTLALDSLASRIDHVVFSVDDTEVATLQRGPYAFTLATESFPEGEHLITVSVYVRNPRGGLLALVGAPEVLLGVPVVFDQRSPSPVVLSSVEVEGDRARLQWAPNRDANFYAYLVVRRARWTVAPGWPSSRPVVDTLYDRNVTTYLDDPVPASAGYGARAEYEVLVWNRREVSGPSNALVATFGTHISALFPAGPPGAFSADGETIYVPRLEALVAYATTDHRELRRLPYGSISQSGSTFAGVSLHPNGTDLAVLTVENNSYRRRLNIVDAATLSVRRSFLLPEEAFGVQFSENGDVLAAGQRRLYVLDAQTGDVTASSQAVFGSPVHVVGTTADRRSAYVISYADARNAVLHRVPLNTLESAGQFTWPQSNGVIGRGPDGKIYVYTHPTVTVLDGQSMAPVGTFGLGLPGGYGNEVRAFVVAAGTLYVSYRLVRPDWSEGGVVAAFDLATRTRRQAWKFADPVDRVRTTGSRWLYVDTWVNENTTWLLPL